MAACMIGPCEGSCFLEPSSLKATNAFKVKRKELKKVRIVMPGFNQLVPDKCKALYTIMGRIELLLQKVRSFMIG